MTRRVIRPLVLLAALVPVHLGAQLLLLGRVVPAFLVLPLLAVAAYEAADGAADRYAERKHRVGAAGPPVATCPGERRDGGQDDRA